MASLLIVTHGSLAQELVEAVRTIVGKAESLEALSIGWTVDVDRARERIQDAIERVGGGGPVLVLTDMFGGTPSNVALSLLEPGRVEVVTGVNLPMLIKGITLAGDLPLAEVARRVAEQGKQAIQVASELLEARA